jgi:hypothetical protein
MKATFTLPHNKLSFSLTMICSLFYIAAFSQNWTGNLNSDWNNSANWSAMPANNATVTINPANFTGAAVAPVINAASSFDPNKLSVLNGASLTVSDDITIHKDLVIDLGGQVTMTSGTITVEQNVLIGDGKTSNSSLLTINGAHLVVNGNLAFKNDAGNYMPSVTVNSGSLSVSGDLTWFGQSPGAGTPKFNVKGGTATIDGNILNLPASTVTLYISMTAGNLNFSGDSIRTINAIDSIKQIYPATFTLSDTVNWYNFGVFRSDSATTTFNGYTRILSVGQYDFHSIKINAAKTLDLITPTYINVKGNFTNNGVYIPRTNSTIFTGSAQQFIDGSTPTVFSTLILNNPSSQGVTLNQSASVSGSIGFTAGKINTSSTNLLTVLNGAVTNPGNATSFVNGPLRKKGNVAFEFPIGKNSSWGRLHISAPSNINSEFTAEYFDAPHTNTTSVNAPLVNVSSVEHWSLLRTNSTDSVEVSLYWDNAASSNISDCSILTMAYWNGTGWDNIPCSTVGNCNGTASGLTESDNAQANYGLFTFGYLDVVTGIKDPATSNAALFPNPNNGKATLYLKDNYKEASFRLMDVTGKIITEHQAISTENYELDLSSQPNGVYYIEVSSNHTISRIKIIKI